MSEKGKYTGHLGTFFALAGSQLPKLINQAYATEGVEPRSAAEISWQRA